MSLSNSIRELIFKQQEINNTDINFNPVSRTITDFTSVEKIFTDNMIKNQHKIIELSKKSVKSKTSNVILDKVDSISEISDDEIESDLSEDNISDIKKSYEDLDHPTDDIEFIKSDIVEDTLISPDIDSNEIDIPDIINDDNDDTVEEMDIDVKDIKVDTTEGLPDKSSDKPEKSDMSGGKMDGLLFECLNKIHLKGGKTPNLSQNFEMPKKEFSGGEVKKIQLTEKYDFF